MGTLDPVPYEMMDIWRSVDGAEFESAFGVSATCAHLVAEGEGERVDI